MSMKIHNAMPGRRSFLAGAGSLIGGFVAAPAWPGALRVLLPAGASVSLPVDVCGDWTVDHVCSHWPPYAFDTGAARPHTLPVRSAGADWHWVI